MALLTLSMTDTKKYPLGQIRLTFFLAEKLFFSVVLMVEMVSMLMV